MVLSNKELSGIVRAVSNDGESKNYECLLKFRTSQGGEVSWKGFPEPVRKSIDEVLRSGNCLRVGEALWKAPSQHGEAEDAGLHGVDISPSDRQEAAFDGCTLEVIGEISSKSENQEGAVATYANSCLDSRERKAYSRARIAS
eukprot:CAMPEP_0114513814 /NCGR_PEP_ID=MMETSP0109-20121206/15797_1 /TAXON_ID=29199 /ORGANISM="Chlorarachnion reptans, Strain CCCM449" /LENGTH=142 /DNA_ID=CAMNT_0001693765 /DNA_START=138 /DNA_END=566 /DNA_ORIENTATION=-